MIWKPAKEQVQDGARGTGRAEASGKYFREAKKSIRLMSSTKEQVGGRRGRA